jgi:hypothetical protein
MLYYFFLTIKGFTRKAADMINEKVLDWIEGYMLTRMFIFGDFIGTVKRADFFLDLDTKSDYFRKFEGRRIQALSLPVKNRNLSTLLGEIEACFHRGWNLLDAGEWTEADFNELYEISQQISAEIWILRGEAIQTVSTVKVEGNNPPPTNLN